MSVFDPKNPQMSSINLGARVSRPLRSIMSAGSRLMSNNKFIKTMRAQMSGSGKMTDKMARKVSLRAAVGVKDLGLDTAKHKKAFADGMHEEGMLSTMYHKNPKLALEAYKKAAEVMGPEEHKPEHSAHNMQATNDREEHKVTDPRSAAEHRHETHDRMQKIRDDIERQKKEHQAHEVSVSHSFGVDTRQETTTSIAHVNTHPGVGAPVLTSQQNAVGSINSRENQVVSGSINQVLKQQPANDNVEEEKSVNGPIVAANDNEEFETPGLKKAV